MTRLLTSARLRRGHLTTRIVLCTSGVYASRRIIQLGDRVRRVETALRRGRKVNHGLSFVTRRVGHRTGAVLSGTGSVRISGRTVDLGARVRGVERRVRGVR